jgi:hypothetical protein
MSIHLNVSRLLFLAGWLSGTRFRFRFGGYFPQKLSTVFQSFLEFEMGTVLNFSFQCGKRTFQDLVQDFQLFT